MSLEARINAILASPKPGAAPQVRTSEAFAERFRAEAQRSGLTVDLAEKSSDELVRLCPVCGAQNGRLSPTCFNCQSDLDAAPAPQRAGAPARPARPEDARWKLIMRAPAPLTLRVPVSRERFLPYAVKQMNQQQVLDRFLAVFVEREKAERDNAKSVARFDQRTVLDKFLSVFIERQ